MTFKEVKNRITDKQMITIIKALGGDCDESLSTDNYLIFSSLLYHGLSANEHSYKMYYYRGLKEWYAEKGFLRDTVLSCQDKFYEILKYFRLDKISK